MSAKLETSNKSQLSHMVNTVYFVSYTIADAKLEKTVANGDFEIFDDTGSIRLSSVRAYIEESNAPILEAAGFMWDDLKLNVVSFNALPG